MNEPTVRDPSKPELPPDLSLEGDDVVESVEVIDEPTNDDGDEEGRTSGFDGIGTRRTSRERAVSLLYEAEQRGVEPAAAILAGLPVAPDEFAVDLVEGVSRRKTEIDALIERFSVGWPLARMPALDRALLRLGIYELLADEVPVGVCISESVELAKRYSTDESHRFVNGMLARIAHEVRS